MADPVLVARAVVMALSDERIRKGVGWTIVAVLSPIIVVVAIICGMLSGTANHNSTALDLCFHGGVIAGNVPADYREHIENMRSSFAVLDGAINEVNSNMEDGDSLDSTRIKAIFYSLYFGADQPSKVNSKAFVDSFVTYEERTRAVSSEDGSTHNESYTVAVPIKNQPIVYVNIAKAMGTTVSNENKSNATEIYFRILYGKPAPTYGSEFDDFINGLAVSTEPFIGEDGFCSPIGANWRGAVTSEFGYRADPFTKQKKGHGGIDLGMQKGTPIYSALSGTVMLVRYSTTGYGYHVIVDHGGGVITLYGHCSSILVSEGEKITVGQEIAKVGSTGRSTGNHLHFEIRVGGVKQNPRNYLP
jgi:murein DD-endopeptidase MepM/ murein hydrolase activator NlpD